VANYKGFFYNTISRAKLIEDGKSECVPQTSSFMPPGKYEKIMNVIFIKIVLFLITKKSL